MNQRCTHPALPRRLAAELVGTALLLVAVVGSGIAASRLSPGDVGLQLLENAAATAAALFAIILAIGPVSGAHLNPVVTLVDRIFGGLTTAEAVAYVAAQTAGGLFGVVVANLMFGLPVVNVSTTVRSGPGLWLAEGVATFGLLLVVFGVVRTKRASVAPFAVGAYIGGAYFFTASTSFANPAVTAARTLSDTFAGIAPASTPAFVGAQLVGALIAAAVVRFLYPSVAEVASEVVVPQWGWPHDGRHPRRRQPSSRHDRRRWMNHVPEVLFVCVHNAGRSQMAAAILDDLAGGRVLVRSAGSAPADTINPLVVEALAELGLDLAKELPKKLTDEAVQASDVVVSMGCGDACPVYAGKRYLDWRLDDPAGMTQIEGVRRIRDEIRALVGELLDELLPASA